MAPSSPITFAHRGARLEHSENTLPAFRHALALGASGLETDAWLASDGEVVLVHDAVVRRFPRRLRVRTATAEQLATFDVPALRQLYTELGTRYELSIDLKGPGAAEAVLAVAREFDAVDRLWLCSGRVTTLARLRELDDAMHLIHSTRKDRIREPLERHAAALTDIGVDALNLHHSNWTAGLVALFHRFEVKAFAWDVQEVRNLDAMIRIGVDGLYSDHVDRMVTRVADLNQ